jgi:hypothetical protein
MRANKSITKVWNADGTISLKARGVVVFKTRSCDHVDSFLEGFFGTADQSQWKMNKTQFRRTA